MTKEVFLKSPEFEVGKKDYRKYISLIKRRAKFEPIQYITGVQPFYNTEISVKKGCLIPRAETEFLVEETLKISSTIKNPVIVDLGCGSGAITKSLSIELKNATFIAIEKSKRALRIAKLNLENCNSVLLLRGDFCKKSFLRNIDIIVCNPPYIIETEFEKLPKEIKEYEPKAALFTPEVFHFYKKAIDFAEICLKDGGFILFEIGSSQAKRYKHFEKLSPKFKLHSKAKDYGKKLRVVVLRKESI